MNEAESLHSRGHLPEQPWNNEEFIIKALPFPPNVILFKKLQANIARSGAIVHFPDPLDPAFWVANEMILMGLVVFATLGFVLVITHKMLNFIVYLWWKH